MLTHVDGEFQVFFPCQPAFFEYHFFKGYEFSDWDKCFSTGRPMLNIKKRFSCHRFAPSTPSGPDRLPFVITFMKTTWARVVLAATFLLCIPARSVSAESKLPDWQKVREAAEKHFGKQRDRQPRDIISRSDVSGVLLEIEKTGWQVPDQNSLLDQVLGDQHVLVATLRSPKGRRFMSQISGRTGMYDRLDRVSEAAGGAQLIRDIVKLPDGEKYAKPKSGGGVPDLVDLLPKNASGKTRRIPDYDKPTGRLYTVDDLLNRLNQIYVQASQDEPVAAP